MVYFLCKAYDSGQQNCCFALSLPVRGAWVEISLSRLNCVMQRRSLPVRGAWVEMGKALVLLALRPCRSPCGERGLKSPLSPFLGKYIASLPVRGAWVEMQC